MLAVIVVLIWAVVGGQLACGVVDMPTIILGVVASFCLVLALACKERKW